MMIATATAVSAALTPMENSEKKKPSNAPGYQVATADEAENADEEQQCTKHEEIFYWYHNAITPFLKS